MIIMVNHTYHVRRVLEEFRKSWTPECPINEEDLIKIIYEGIFSELPLTKDGIFVHTGITPDVYLEHKLFHYFLHRAHSVAFDEFGNQLDTAHDAYELMSYGLLKILGQLTTLTQLVNYAFKFGTETLLGFQTNAEPKIRILNVQDAIGSVLLDVDYDAWA